MLDHNSYKRAVDKIDFSTIDDSAIYNMHNENTKDNNMEKSTHHKIRISLRVGFAVAALVILSCTSVLAYDYYTKNVLYKQTNRNAGETHEYADGAGNALNVNQKDIDGNISVKLIDVKADSRVMYATIQMSTADGSVLMPSSEYNVASMTLNKFENAYLTDGKTDYTFNNMLRVDDGSDHTSATYELTYESDSPETAIINKQHPQLANLSGKELSIVLENLTYPVVNNTDIGFLMTDLNQVTEQIKSGSKKISQRYENIRVCEVTEDLYVIEEGVQPRPCIYITYEFSTDEEKEALLNFKMFNMETGYSSFPVSDLILKKNCDPIRSTIYTQSDNKITVCYYTDRDKEFPNNLSSYKLTGNSETTTKTIEGKWQYKITLELKDQLKYEPNQMIKMGDEMIEVKSVILTDSSVYASGMAMNPKDFINSSEKGNNMNVTLVLRDGTSIAGGNKTGGGYSRDSGHFYIECTLKTLVSSEDVVGIYIGDNYVELQ